MNVAQHKSLTSCNLCGLDSVCDCILLGITLQKYIKIGYKTIFNQGNHYCPLKNNSPLKIQHIG